MLRQLMIAKKIEQRKAGVSDILAKMEKLSTRSAELETAIAEANTDEEIKVVEDAAGELEKEKGELETEKSKLEGEIAELEGELEGIRSKELKKQKREKENKRIEEYLKLASVNSEIELKELIRNYYLNKYPLSKVSQELLNNFINLNVNSSFDIARFISKKEI